MSLRSLCGLLVFCAATAQASVMPAPVSTGEITSLSRLHSLQQPMVAAAPSTLAFERWRTANGVEVLWHGNSLLPMRDVRLYFDAGSARDGQLSGLASAVNSLLAQSTRQRDGQALALAFEQLGARFERSSHRDMALVSLRTLSEPAVSEPAVDLLIEAVTQPAFNEADWRRLQDSMRIGTRQRQQSAAAKASTLFYQRLYEGHPYRQPPGGQMATINRIKPADLRRFHQRYYVAGNATLVLVGDLSREQAGALAERITAALPAGEPAEALPAPRPLRAEHRLHQSFAGEQVHVLMGQLGIRRDDPDFFALQVANEILAGGGFGSLLMRELREQRGLTYGVSSRFNTMRVDGPFQINFATRADQAEEAMQLTRTLLRRVVAEGLDPADVARAIESLAQSYPLGLVGNGQIAAQLGNIGFYGLPSSALTDYLVQLSAVTPEQVNDALRRRLQPDAMLVITVGPALP